MKNIIFLSLPAAGKGTQSRLISEKYKIPHISIGDVLRNEMKLETDIGIKIKEDIKLGNLIDDSIITPLLLNRLSEKDCENGYVLDGFPRTLKQARIYKQILEEQNKQLDYVFYLKIDKEIARKRIVGRLICSSCQEVYNDMFEDTMPKIGGICEKCNGTLVKRDDDSFETFEKRFKTYLEETKPLIEYYKKQNKLYEIDSGINKDYTFKQITNILDRGDSDD